MMFNRIFQFPAKSSAKFRKESLHFHEVPRNALSGHSGRKHRCVLPFFHAGSTLRLNKFLTSELKIRWEMLSPSPVKFAHPLNLEYISLAGRPIKSSTSRPSSLIQRRTGVSSLKYSVKSRSTALGLVKPFWYTRRR